MSIITEHSFYLWSKDTEDGHIGVKRVDQVLRDGEVISQNFHRCVLTPGDDIDAAEQALSQFANAAEVITVAKAAHTKDCVDAFQAKMAKATEKEAENMILAAKEAEAAARAKQK